MRGAATLLFKPPILLTNLHPLCESQSMSSPIRTVAHIDRTEHLAALPRVSDSPGFESGLNTQTCWIPAQTHWLVGLLDLDPGYLLWMHG